jgi:Fic family protein
MDHQMQRLLSDTDRALGGLDKAHSTLPAADLFVEMYVRQEAVLSSRIEGTQSTLEDVLEYEATHSTHGKPKDVQEVANCARAAEYGLARLKEFPLSLRLIREMHAELFRGVRAGHVTPGEFRATQNWIGPVGCRLNEAAFVPPPVHEMHAALDNFEKFIRDLRSLPVLVHCGLAHAQFEMIHPFLDGNGRMGRLLITLLLCQHGALERPVLYLSRYLAARRDEYYDSLSAVHNDGDWERWLTFFLRAVLDVSMQATATVDAIRDMREAHRQLVARKLSRLSFAPALVDLLLRNPIVDARMVERTLGCTYPTANNAIERFVDLGLLREVTSQQRYRLFRYEPYLALFEERRE